VLVAACVIVPLLAVQNSILERVLFKAGQYAETYGQGHDAFVAEETYQQILRPYGSGRTDVLASGAMLGEMGTPNVRKTRSEFALVAVSDLRTWMAFRDTFELDGKSLQPQHNRLEIALGASPRDVPDIAPTATEAASKYNLGRVPRDVNVPTYVMSFLAPRRQASFMFRKTGEKRVDNVPVWVIEYTETGRPTVALSADGRPWPARGEVWVDPVTGRIVKTRIVYDVLDAYPDSQVHPGRYTDFPRSTIDVTYKRDARLNMWVPALMEESYTSRDEVVTCTLTYSNFRAVNSREVPFEVTDAAAASAVPIRLRADAKPARSAFESYFTLLDMYEKGNADLAAAGMAKLDRSALPDPAAVRTMALRDLRIAVVLHLEALLGGAPSETYASVLRVALSRLREADPDFARSATIVFVSVLTLDEYGPLADLLGGPRTTAHPEILLLRGSVAERPVAAELNLQSSARPDQSDFARAELGDAEWDYHAALEGDPHLVEARVRLGRVLLLGRKWTDARRELTRALAEATEPCLQYLANLFLGQAEEGERHFGAAMQAYRSAVARYPDALAASLGLAHALEMNGDATAAWTLARAIVARAEPRPDPWRMYPYGQYWQVDRRLGDLRNAVRK
jgi:tetratricopeptide (TPR) repeat protein